ncbi:MAG: ATP-binding protein, partial [Bacteroidota bacterium]
EMARFRPEGATWFEDVYEDRQGAIWTFSTSTGLIQITEDPFRRFTTDDGVPRYAARASLAADGSVIVSTLATNNDVRAATIQNDQVTTHTYRPTSRPEGLADVVSGGKMSVGQIIDDASGQRWGVANAFLLRIEGNEVEPVAQVSTTYAFLRALAPDPEDPSFVWVGDIDGRLYRIDTEAGTVTDSVHVPDPANGVGNLVVWDFLHAPDGRFLVGTDQGLFALGEDRRLGAVPEVTDQTVFDLTAGPRGHLWAATDSGIVRIRGNRVERVGREAGLPTESVSARLFDDVGSLWLTSGRLLHRARLADVEAVLNGDRASLDVVTLLPSDGHLGPAAAIFGHAKDASGALWIPSAKGVTRLDPALYARQHAQPPEVVLESITTNAGETFALAPGQRLPVGDRTLSLSYTAVDVLAPHQLRFRTYLEGHDAEWADQDDAREVVYGGLAPGTYTLWVQAMNAGGVWSEPVASAPFAVPRRPWETLWFAAFCTFAVGLALVGGYRARIRQLRRQADVLEARIEERTAQLQNEKAKTEAQASQLQQLDAAKSRFFTNVSHEFRTPLTLTLGPLEDLRSGVHGSLTEAAVGQVDVALRNSRRLLRLVGQLLDVARIEAGSVRLELQRGDLAAYVATVAQPFVAAAERRQVAFSVTTPELPVWVPFDADHLDKVIANLLSNALKFTPEGGVVSASVLTEAGEAVVEVSDTGVGIAPTHLERLFDRFFQAEKSEMQPGTGIGLTLAKDLAELHGGTLGVESTVGEGSVFTVRLPLADGEVTDAVQIVAKVAAGLPAVPTSSDVASSDAVTEAERAEEDQTTVLVVDDNADVRAYVRFHLGGAGYRITEAEDGEAALDAVRQRLPDAIVSDVMMPRRDGFSLLGALRADPETDFVPVVLLTARAEVEDRLAGLGLGADDYLTKPFDARELTARVDNLIASRRRLRERFAVASAAPEGPVLASADQQFVDAVEAAIAEHLPDETFDVSALGAAVGQSRSTLHRRLSQVLDESPSALLRRRRLEHGATLLRQRVGTVSEVAYASGFKSVSHFSSSFGRHFGVSPSAWAETHAGEPGSGAQG